VLSGGGARGMAHIGVLKVLEEVGLRPDYIAGTSAGAIMGGLYALGYTAAEIEQVMQAQNWQELLQDRVDRRWLPLEEKNDDGKYLLAFPIQNWKISLPRGLSGGENISLLLAQLTQPAHSIPEFKNFPIPFECIATDISNGRMVVLNHGSLAEAIRASMAIPSVFTPVEIEGKLLVDGMVARNFPVSNVKAMGADLVVGVDVGTALYGKEELDSLQKILDQSMSFFGAAEADTQNQLCNVLIIPDTRGYGSASYADWKILVAIGEKAAREKLPELRALAERLKRTEPVTEKALLRPNLKGTEYITEVRVTGQKNVSRELIDEHLQIQTPEWLTAQEIKNAILRLYGSGFFERVTYTLEPDAQAGEGKCLMIRLNEAQNDSLKVGLGYDSDTQSALLFNGTFRNFVVEGSKISLDAKLGENASFRGSRYVPFGWRTGLGMYVELRYNQFNVFSHDDEPNVQYHDYFDYAAEVHLQKNFFNALSMGLGLEKEWAVVQGNNESDPALNRVVDFLNYIGYARLDTLDRTYFPRSGIEGRAELRYITRELPLQADPTYRDYPRYTTQLKIHVPVHERVTVFGGGYMGVASFVDGHVMHQYHVGGLYDYDAHQVAFPGFDFMERHDSAVWITHMGTQVEIMTDVYLLAQVHTGRMEDELNQLFREGPVIVGGALTLGALSPIGPLELSVVGNNERQVPMIHFSLGHRF
jgi:NTE family protein